MNILHGLDCAGAPWPRRVFALEDPGEPSPEFLEFWDFLARGLELSLLPRLHLVLTFHWFDEVVSGRKRIEYRAMTPRWKKLIWDRRFELGAVRFSRGYTSTMTTRRILRITRGPCPIPGWDGDFYQIHFS